MIFTKEVNFYLITGTLVVTDVRPGCEADWVPRLSAPFARAAVRGCLDTKHGRAQTTGLAVAPSHNVLPSLSYNRAARPQSQ